MTSDQSSPFSTGLTGPAPELLVSRDLVKRGLMVSPLFCLMAGVIWGLNGAYSCAFAMGLVLLNFSMAAALMAYTAPISLALMTGASLFGYLVRLGLIFLAVMLVKDFSWVSLQALGCTIIVTHLGLLFWELKYISASLAFPGLKPSRQKSSQVQSSTNKNH